MSIKEVDKIWSHCELDYVKKFVLHDESEVAELPSCCVGSTAIVCKTGNEYVCNREGVWKPKEEAIAEDTGETGGGVSSWNDLTDKPFYDEDDWVLLCFADANEGDGAKVTTRKYQDISPEKEYRVYYNDDYGNHIELEITEIGELFLMFNPAGTSLGNEDSVTVTCHDLDMVYYEFSVEPVNEFVRWKLEVKDKVPVPLNSRYLPKAEAVSDVTAAPTADEFNALLATLRAAGYLAT